MEAVDSSEVSVLSIPRSAEVFFFRPVVWLWLHRTVSIITVVSFYFVKNLLLKYRFFIVCFMFGSYNLKVLHHHHHHINP